MGQRHQIYIVEKNKDGYRALGAWHHQWTFGMGAVTNFTRLYNLIKANAVDSFDKKWCQYRLSDNRYLDTAVKSTYGLEYRENLLSMVHNETEANYLIEDGMITPQNGDNNDGCSLIVIDNTKEEVRGCLFTPGHVEGSHYRVRKDGSNKAWTREKYLNFYYNKEEQNDPRFVEAFQPNIELLQSVKVKPVSTIELRKLMKKVGE